MLLRLNGWRQRAFIGADLMGLTGAFLLAALSSLVINEWLLGRPYRDLMGDDVLQRLAQFGAIGLCMLLWFHTRGHYRRRLPLWSAAQDIVIASILALLTDGFLMFAFKADFSRLWLGQAWLLTAALIPVMRGFIITVLDARGLWRLPVVVVGGGETAQKAVEALKSERSLGYDIVGVRPLSAVGSKGNGSWEALYAREQAQLVVLALSDADLVGGGELIADLARRRLPFAIAPALQGLPVLGFDRIYFFSQDVMLLAARNNLEQPLSRGVKFVFDLVAASMLVAILAPVFVFFALLIMRDGGPVVYGHTRIGRGGRPFTCLKFRTMAPDAERRLQDMLATDPDAATEWSVARKLRNDPRVTPIGRFLRASSLDELLQLFNVLRGEMSLVGPRPVTGEELALYGRDVSYYLETRPGMTGLWQISGRNEIAYDERVRLDVWYVKNWTLWHDIAILVRTIPVVWRRVGAY
ncbi:Undecaprenyl-phosphate galactose phosphotransferase WbaP [Azospirillum fermentarium]|uniref:undecaprenyl-phosphate galactose phosphotransferase WbaP n=1 Tax=Azospirillum fermentarium TaxID=1233114 RepID=UPI002226E8CF|nr:undecaprenyl-phosphate galactose phosphotransferase WbaP [Azospirillum fermentarium]MCW2249593.1 Undecaprenyl-phosphate galactose phosphotransferase WbaP [Azospirillum fermentarium]